MKNYKSFFSSKVFIAIIFTLIGVGATLLALDIGENKKHPKNPLGDIDKMIEQHSQKMLSDLGNDAILADMTGMGEKMDEVLLAHKKQMAKILEQATKSDSNGNKTSILSHQDNKNYIYELNFSGFKKEDIIVEIKDKNLGFSAKKEKKDNNSQNLSGFYYSFSLPKDAAAVPEIVKEDNKIIVKFSKLTKI
jgi:HSP20 family molecular chaperone IbpA